MNRLVTSFVCLAIGITFLIHENESCGQDAPIELIGVRRISGKMRDLSQLEVKLEDGSVSDQFGGLSAIDYVGSGNRFLLLADRGAGDGAVSFPCRLHEAKLQVNEADKSIEFELLETRMLVSKEGQPLVGSLTAHAADLASTDLAHWTAFDPEGLRRLSNGNLLITEEYGPRVVMFDGRSRLIREVEVPEKFRFRAPENGNFVRGAYPNRGLEGVAVTPSGARFVAAIQSPLIQDGVIEADKCVGMNSRWIIYDANAQVEREVVYPMENLKTGVSEILAVSESKFLVLERDSKGGKEAKTKRIYLCDIAKASDVRNVAALPQLDLPADIQPVSKRLFIDLLDNAFGIAGKHAPEKPEGLTWGEPLADGRRTLWVCCDNDFDVQRTTDFYCFAIAESAL
jgi:hypothetical protein